MSDVRIVTQLPQVIEESGEYEFNAIFEELIASQEKIAALEEAMNIANYEGFHIYPVRNSLGEYVYFDYPKRLVLCVIAMYWG